MDNEFGIFYAVTTILDSSKRMNAFHEDDWTKDKRKFQKQQILQFYQDNYQQYEPLRTQLEEEGDLSPIEGLNMLFSRTSKLTSKDTGTFNEIERYLSEQPLSDSNVDILSQWRSIKAVYPTVARMARSLLAVFLTSLPVERQFNVDCDTCTYRRGKLQGETIRKIMILKHSDKDLIDPGLLDDYQLAEWEDHKNETSIARKTTFDEKVLAASLHFDHAVADEVVGDEPPAERTRKRHQRRWS